MHMFLTLEPREDHVLQVFGVVFDHCFNPFVPGLHLKSCRDG